MGNNSCVADVALRLMAILRLIALRLKACILYSIVLCNYVSTVQGEEGWAPGGGAQAREESREEPSQEGSRAGQGAGGKGSRPQPRQG